MSIAFSSHLVGARGNAIICQEFVVFYFVPSNDCKYVVCTSLGWKQSGALYVARTQDRFIYYKRALQRAQYVKSVTKNMYVQRCLKSHNNDGLQAMNVYCS